MTTDPRNAGRSATGLSTDEALIALLIGAMEANGHVSAEEAARAHHIIWSTRRFRRRAGEKVDKLIEHAKALAGRVGTDDLIAAAAASIPSDLQEPAFALAADLVLVDGKMEPAERRFLVALGHALGISPARVDEIAAVMQIKNSA